MLETMIQAWLSVWLYVMTGMGIYLGILVIKNRKTWSQVDILCTCAVIVLVLHVIEEWVFPGGLHYSYNIAHGSTLLSRYPMNRLTDMITNFGGVVLGCIILKFFRFRKPAAIAVMIFSFVEVGIHIMIGITDMGIFGQYGMNTLYSPGLVTSLFGFLPVGIGLIKELILIKENRPSLKQWIMGIAGMFVFMFLLINLPEDVLGTENSPYEFTNRGFYEEYGELFEAENGYDYYDATSNEE